MRAYGRLTNPPSPFTFDGSENRVMLLHDYRFCWRRLGGEALSTSLSRIVVTPNYEIARHKFFYSLLGESVGN